MQNFGQDRIKRGESLRIVYFKDNKEVEVASGKIPGLKPYQKTNVELKCWQPVRERC